MNKNEHPQHETQIICYHSCQTKIKQALILHAENTRVMLTCLNECSKNLPLDINLGTLNSDSFWKWRTPGPLIHNNNLW